MIKANVRWDQNMHPLISLLSFDYLLGQLNNQSFPSSSIFLSSTLVFNSVKTLDIIRFVLLQLIPLYPCLQNSKRKTKILQTSQREVKQQNSIHMDSPIKLNHLSSIRTFNIPAKKEKSAITQTFAVLLCLQNKNT